MYYLGMSTSSLLVLRPCPTSDHLADYYPVGSFGTGFVETFVKSFRSILYRK